jgi:ribosome-associated heat shock protein Hsp15
MIVRLNSPSGKSSPETAAVRLDKWLWAARFFKTRSLATAAVEGGKVKLGGVAVKPGKAVRMGDELSIRTPTGEFVLVVTGLSDKRGPAGEAMKLYAETEQSRQAREVLREQRRQEPAADSTLKGRPTKKARRQILRFTGV